MPISTQRRPWQLAGFGAWTVCAVFLFRRPLAELCLYALHDDLHSHMFLIPLIAGYLLHQRRSALPAPGRGSPAAGTGLLTVAAFTLLLVQALTRAAPDLPRVDVLALLTFAFVTALLAGVMFCFGSGFFRAALFPLLFLYFLMPLPTLLNAWVTSALQVTSAYALLGLLKLTGTTFAHQGMVFMLPGFTIEVAEECSGIRSSLVLLVTSLVAGDLFLRSRWNRSLLALAFFPIGVLRNAVRILALVLLSLHVDPAIIHGPLHRSGGPPFFALSLIPLFVILLLLRRLENRVRDEALPADRAAESADTTLGELP